ncbi:hypothetical protein BC835DRAFT_1369693 [Cytidiella melzeri]|nr:hypothetical protein BC835DRAFT_1369693 [Cytidiella melzeri]
MYKKVLTCIVSTALTTTSAVYTSHACVRTTTATSSSLRITKLAGSHVDVAAFCTKLYNILLLKPTHTIHTYPKMRTRKKPETNCKKHKKRPSSEATKFLL